MADGALLPGWLLWSLPAMFLLHDAEEVLFLPPWLRRNRELLARRFPQLARRMRWYIYDIPRFFREEFFETKKVVYTPKK
uniref:HXXEE domain-containing protein n=1 Tax=Alistipes onderdonkii TaxID=328813 RepID=UPI00402698DE